MKCPAAQVYGKNFLKLPRLPIPSLDDTFARYEASVRALKGPKKVDSHLKKMATFRTTTAQAAQQALLDRDAAAEASGGYPYSYIEELWDDGYLAFRGSSCININAALSLNQYETTSAQPQAEVAARFATRCIRWWRNAVEGNIHPDQKLCISQDNVQFGACRFPGAQRDTVEVNPDARHISVLCKGYMFTVPVLSEDATEMISEAALQKRLQSIVETCAGREASTGVAVLTAAGRSDWAAAYNDILATSDDNAAAMKKFTQSIALFCLDTNDITADEIPYNMLHGVRGDRWNRWYDRHQFIVSPAGYVSMNFEHSSSDGQTWARVMDDVDNDMRGKVTTFLPQLGVSAALSGDAAATAVEEVTFTVPHSHEGTIRNAAQTLEKQTSNVLVQRVAIPGMGKDALKKMRVSPDALCQTAFHLAHYRMHGIIAPTYESCTTAGFFHGRTETIRTATVEMFNLLSDPLAARMGSLSSEEATEVAKRIRDASEKHRVLVKEASAAQGVDRHLLALKTIVKDSKDTAGLKFFNDGLYAYSGTWMMSTSSVARDCLDCFTFGPVVPDGYGLGYAIQGDNLTGCFSSFKTSDRDASAFAEEVEKACREMTAVLQRA